MTNEQYQKRIQFLEHIKKNYVAVKDKVLVFYFNDYNTSTIRTEYIQVSDKKLLAYNNERSETLSGAITLFYDWGGEIKLQMTDTYLSIALNLTDRCTLFNEIREPLDLKEVAKEMRDLFELLKTK